MLRLQSDLLVGPSAAHGFFGRQGGVSTGILASLNCGPGSSDVRDYVIENRRRALAALTAAPDARLLTLYQCHSADVVTVSAGWDVDQAPRADAMATRMPGIALGILTADCAPVLLADSEAGVIGAAHAGWKGALGGVIESVVAAMERLGADRSRIAAVIGPCITQANYEVGAEFRATFEGADRANIRWFMPSERPDHFRFDLPGFVQHQLRTAGVAHSEALLICTYARAEDFFSYRRATHRGEKDYGRELSAILLKA